MTLELLIMIFKVIRDRFDYIIQYIYGLLEWSIDEYIDLLGYLNTDFSRGDKYTAVAHDGKKHSIFDPTFWDKQWVYWGERKKLGKGYYKDIARIVNKYKFQRILEIGCGPGYLLEDLQNDCNITAYTGFDISYEAVKICNNKIKNSNFEVFQDTINNTESYLTKDNYDLVVAVDVIEHITESEFQKLIDLLMQRETSIIFVTPYLNHVPTPTHIQCFSKRKFISVFRRHHIIEFRPYNHFKEFLIFVNKQQYKTEH